MTDAEVTGMWSRRRVLTSALLAGPLAAALAGCGRSEGNWAAPRGPAAPTGQGVAPAPSGPAKPQYVPGKVILGSYLGLKGMTLDQALALRRQQLGRNLGISHIYYEWDAPMPSTSPAPAGMIPLISWWGTDLASILNGSQDDLIVSAADALAALKQPIFLRWAWEMNGNWYRWDGVHNGNNPASFAQAWRRLHGIFLQRKAVNVSWVWAPNLDSAPSKPWNDMQNYYPGDDYVDWVGVSAYGNGRTGPESLFQDFTNRYKARKPIMIAETGVEERGGTVKADWIRALHTWLLANPAVGALVWFDTDNDGSKTEDWRIDSSPTALAAFKEMVDDPRFS